MKLHYPQAIPFFLLITLSLLAFASLRSQDLGLYFPPESTYSILESNNAVEKLGFKAILFPHDQAKRFTPSDSFNFYVYPNLASTESGVLPESDTLLQKLYFQQMSSIPASFLFVGFLPEQLLEKGYNLKDASNVFYIERVLTYSSLLTDIAPEKEKWTFISKYDLPFIKEKLLESSTNLIWKSYSAEDLSLNYLNRIVQIADSIEINSLYIDATHLEEALSIDPNLSVYLRSISRYERPVQEIDVPTIYASTLYERGFILIFLIFLTFAVHATISGRYMRSLKRFLGNSRFFLQEIQSWRDSITLNSWIVLLQFVIIHSLVQFILISLLFSPTAFFLLITKLGLSIQKDSFSLQLTLLLLLTLFNLVLHILILFWNYFTANGFRYLGQSMGIYTFGFHTHLLIGVPIYILISEIPTNFILILSALLITFGVIPFNHFRAQLQTSKCSGNEAIRSIGTGFFLFWLITISLISFVLLKNPNILSYFKALMATS